MMMSNISKRIKKKKTKESSPSWSELPDAVALSCVARVPRSDYATLSRVSRRHRYLVASPDLCRTRWLIGCTEPSLYVCLSIVRNPIPRWFVLTRNRRLEPITSNPNQPRESSSFVVVDWGIYVIGGTLNAKPTSHVWFLDCYSKTWRRLPSMNTARASATASFLDGKIYVFGGCGDSSNWAEVFDPKTQTWSEFVMPKMEHGIHHSVVIENKKVYVVDDKHQSFYLSLNECRDWTRGTNHDSVPGNRNDWCAIGKLLYCLDASGSILWCEPGDLDWKAVKGYQKRQFSITFPATWSNPLPSTSTFTVLKRGEIVKLCSNSAGNIVIFVQKLSGDPKTAEHNSAN